MRPDFAFFSSSSSNVKKPCDAAPMRGRPGWHTTQPMTLEETRARLLYRDGLILVLDKPRDVAVHRGRKGGSSLEDDFAALRFGLPRNPALAHRLPPQTPRR